MTATPCIRFECTDCGGSAEKKTVIEIERWYNHKEKLGSEVWNDAYIWACLRCTQENSV